MPSSLSARERDVIAAMRASDRAEQAIYNYATTFAGADQAISTERLTGDYEQSYE